MLKAYQLIDSAGMSRSLSICHSKLHLFHITGKQAGLHSKMYLWTYYIT